MKFRIDGQWRWLVALGGILVPGIVFGAFSVPHTFEPGTPIKASEMNANFEALAAKIDAQAVPPAAAPIGTLTLDGLVSALPITKFSQSIKVAWVPGGGAAGKPTFSEVIVQRPVGAGTPDITHAMLAGTSVPDASIELGTLSIGLEYVRITGVSVLEPRGGVPQEAIALTFRAITWSWDDGVNPVMEVSFDLLSGVGGGGAVQAFNFGYFPPGVTADLSYAAISGYRHQVACITATASCKPTHGAVIVDKALSADTIGELGTMLGVNAHDVTLDWYVDEATVNNGIELTQSVLTEFAVTTSNDGQLSESLSFTYPRITWRAGITERRWDVLQNAEF